jgi:hypothetical protein
MPRPIPADAQSSAARSRFGGIMAETHFRRLDRSLYRGVCPQCHGDRALAWEDRPGYPRDSWSCTDCAAGGSILGLWRRTRRPDGLAARAAA